MADKIQVRRGTDAQRSVVVFDLGEPVFTTDTKQLYIGDGSTTGGIPVFNNHETTYDHDAYDTHLSNTSNPHAVTAAQVGADVAGSAAAVQSNLNTHTSDTSNPHSVTTAQIGAIPTTQKGVANGVATLGADAKIPTSQLPSIAITDVFVVADITARDALTVQSGDIAVVTDVGTGQPNSYIYDGSTWLEIQKPADVVSSVNGMTGAVVLDDGSIAYTRADVDRKNIDTASDTLGSAINDLDDALDTHINNTTNAHGINTKADKVSGATAGNIATLDINGNLVDSTYKPSDFESTGAVSTHETTYNHSNYDTHLSNTSNPHSVTIAQIGAAAEVHTHTSSQITDFDTSVDNRITGKYGQPNGIKQLDVNGFAVIDGGTIV